MKSSTTLTLVACVSIVAFFSGRWKSSPSATASVSPQRPSSKSTLRPKTTRGSVEISENPAAKRISNCEGISSEQATRLTSKERLAALANGAAIYQSGNQIAVLTGLISALTRDEMRDAMAILGGIQDRGNFQTQEVWDALWKQWGRVDPKGCLADFGENAQSKSRKDARNVMAGWLETDADAALAWAMEPKTALLQATAAAAAITNNANGDLKQLAVAIRSLPAESQTAYECLLDYFDIASLTEKNPSAADIYAELDPSLQAAAWPVAMLRLGLTDPQEAATWLEKHASDEGADYRMTQQFVEEMAMKDPVATLNWASKLPGVRGDNVEGNPLLVALSTWSDIDPEAAEAWMKKENQGK